MNLVEMKSKVIDSISLLNVIKCTESYGIAKIYLSENEDLYLSNEESSDTLVCTITNEDISAMINDLAIGEIATEEDTILNKSLQTTNEVFNLLDSLTSKNSKLQEDKYKVSIDKIKTLTNLEEIYEESTRVLNTLKLEWLFENNHIWNILLNEKINWDLIENQLVNIKPNELKEKSFISFQSNLKECGKALEAFIKDSESVLTTNSEVANSFKDIKSKLDVIITETDVLAAKYKKIYIQANMKK